MMLFLLQAELVQADRREEEVRQEKRVLEERCREADGEVLLLQKRLEAEVGTRLKIQELQARAEGEVKRLQEQGEVAKEEAREFSTKLAQVTGREAAAQTELKSVRTELEMAQMHLAQFRGSEADAGSSSELGGAAVPGRSLPIPAPWSAMPPREVASLTRELGQARNGQVEALASKDRVGREGDLQAGRLSKTKEQENEEKKRLAMNLVQGVNGNMVLGELCQKGPTFKPDIFPTNDNKLSVSKRQSISQMPIEKKAMRRELILITELPKANPLKPFVCQQCTYQCKSDKERLRHTKITHGNK